MRLRERRSRNSGEELSGVLLVVCTQSRFDLIRCRFTARKMRMAISPRFAAMIFRTGRQPGRTGGGVACKGETGLSFHCCRVSCRLKPAAAARRAVASRLRMHGRCRRGHYQSRESPAHDGGAKTSAHQRRHATVTPRMVDGATKLYALAPCRTDRQTDRQF